MSSSIHFGTCSWNYNSWIGLVYSGKCNRAADYLYEYAQKYDTVEVDSWFYKIPNPYEAGEYLAASGDKLTFSCKLFNGITLTHYRSKTGNRSLEKNDDFLSVDLFKRFVDSIWEMHSRTRLVSIEMEFEYLNLLPPEKNGPIRQNKRTHLKVACFKERAYINPSTVDV